MASVEELTKKKLGNEAVIATGRKPLTKEDWKQQEWRWNARSRRKPRERWLEEDEVVQRGKQQPPKEYEERVDELKNVMKGKTAKNLDEMVRRIDSPCNPLPLKFLLSQLESYDGLKDPLDHITTFKMTLSLQQTSNEIVCQSFPTTLKGAAWVWFSKLAQSSIDDFD